MCGHRSHWSVVALFGGAFLSSAPVARATPSTTYWAPSTPAVQGFGVLHLTYDSYFGAGGLYPVDVGLTLGVLPMQQLQMEVGFDLLYPTIDSTGMEPDELEVPIYFNGKIGTPEDVLFPWQPAWSLGIYNAGIVSDVTDYNIVYGMLGKTIPQAGILQVGGYYGLNDKLLVSPDGDKAQAGLLAGYYAPPIDVPIIDKLLFCADLQTGHNSLGGGGAGVYVYFTPAVSLLTGPVFFFEEELQPGQSPWMWTAQLDVDIDFKSGDGQ